MSIMEALITLNDRNAKNSVTDKAIRDISLRRLDYSKFKTYKELQKYVIEIGRASCRERV